MQKKLETEQIIRQPLTKIDKLPFFFFRLTLMLHDHTASRLVKSEQEENFDKCQRPEDAVTVGFERRVDAYPTVVFALVDPAVGGVVFGNLTLLAVHHD